jgi:hypothetical protein
MEANRRALAAEREANRPLPPFLDGGTDEEFRP